MKVIVIGCTHAGTAAIMNAVALHDAVEITVYERNDNISFLSCGIALYVEGVVKDPLGFFYCSPEKLAEHGVCTRMRHSVTNVDTVKKVVTVKNLETEEIFEDTYDKLIVTSGSWPIRPGIDKIDLPGIHICKNYDHAKRIVSETAAAKNVVVIGAGYIGVELVVAFEVQGKNVTLIDMEPQILPKYIDREFVAPAMDEFRKRGVTLALGERVLGFAEGEGGRVAAVTTDKGTYAADLVIVCVGFLPNTSLLKGKVDMLPNGAIKVNEYMHTSNPDILAAGDCCSVWNNAKRCFDYIPLATNAVRMGTLAAHNLVSDVHRYPGTQGTSGIKIYDYCIAATGLTEEAAIKGGMEIESRTFTDNNRPEFMPDYEDLRVKLVYERDTRRIIGGQIISQLDLTAAINTVSLAIENNMTVEEFAFTDFFFQPHFNKPWNFLNSVALLALSKD